MENNRFLAYDTQGNFLGFVDMRLGNEVMIVHHGKLTKPLREYLEGNPQCILHLDNQSNSSQSWEVKVGRPYRDRNNEFWIKHISDRTSQHKRPEERYWWTPIWEFIQTLYP